jgi:hypothetical protein
MAVYRLGKSAVKDGDLVPNAVPDPIAAALALGTVVAIVLWRVSPLPLMTAGGAVGVVLRGR